MSVGSAKQCLAGLASQLWEGPDRACPRVSCHRHSLLPTSCGIDSMLLTVDYTCAVHRQILQHVAWADAFVAVLHAACMQNRAKVVLSLDSELRAPKGGCCGYVVVACSHGSRAAGMVSMAPGCLVDVWL
jgi:hypothetical protein